MGSLELYYQSGGMVNPNITREYVRDDVKKSFDEELEIIRGILNPPDKKGQKIIYSQRDANIIALALKDLYDAQKKGGFDNAMNDATTLLFALFKTAGFDPGSKSYIIDLKSLQNIGDKGITYEGRNISLDQILEIIDPKNFEDATRTLGDATLDFVRWAYNNYAKEVQKLGDAVEAATKIIGNLSSLQAILNHVKTKMPDNYKFPPNNWSEIPTELQEKIKVANPQLANWDLLAKNDATEFKKVRDYLANPPGSNDYVTWSDIYFKKALGSTADPLPGDIPALLNMRDNLIRQMAILKKGGAPTGDGTPYDTISKLLDTINTQFPISTYPIPIPNPDSPADATKDLQAGKNWNVEFGGVPKNDGTSGFTFDFSKIPAKYSGAKDQITKWIDSAQGDGKTNDILDKALNANQRLSDDMSKQLQLKNQQLTQVLDLLTQLIDMLNKILSGTAQKIARG